LLALAAAALLVLGAACSGSSKSSAPATRSTMSGTQAPGAAGGTSQVTTTIQMGSATATVGAEAKAELKALAVGAPGLGAWTTEVAYDPTVVSVSGCTGTESSACNTHKDDHTIRLAGASGTGLQGDVTLMTLTFQCKAAGTSPLKVTAEVLADGTIGNPLTINAPTQNGSITCS
jgi:hypothetical protein